MGRRIVAGSERRSAPGRVLRLVVSGAMLSIAPLRLVAQVTSVGSTVPTLSAVAAWNIRTDSGVTVQANSVTLLVTSGGNQSIAGLVDGQVNAFPAPVRLNTQWTVTSSLVSAVDLIGYFSVPASALTSGTTNLGSSLVEGRMTTGRATSWTAFTQGPVGGQGVAGGTLHLFRQLIISPINGVGQRNDQLDLRLNLSGQPVLPPGMYAGTLTLRATAY